MVSVKEIFFFLTFLKSVNITLASTVKFSCNSTMSNNAVTVNSNDWNSWIEEAISKKLIKYYEFEQFYNFQEIGSGGFGKVSRANWKNSHKYYALKSFLNFNDATIKEIVHEVIIMTCISVIIICMYTNS